MCAYLYRHVRHLVIYSSWGKGGAMAYTMCSMCSLAVLVDDSGRLHVHNKRFPAFRAGFVCVAHVWQAALPIHSRQGHGVGVQPVIAWVRFVGLRSSNAREIELLACENQKIIKTSCWVQNTARQNKKDVFCFQIRPTVASRQG